MNTRMFANYMMIFGLVFALAGFFVRSNTLEQIKPLETEARQARSMNAESSRGVAPTEKLWERVHVAEKFMWGGAGLLVLGFGIAWSAKKDEPASE